MLLEKDAEYQRVGNYFWPTQTVEKNLHRSFLRFQVNEQGVMSTDFHLLRRKQHPSFCSQSDSTGWQLCRNTGLQQTATKLRTLGEKIEKADYKMGADGNVMGFLYLNRDKNIKVEYIGERKYTTTMPPADRQALAGIYELSQLLSSIEQIKKEQEEANLKIQFVTKKIEQKQQEEKAEQKDE